MSSADTIILSGVLVSLFWFNCVTGVIVVIIRVQWSSALINVLLLM